MAWTNLSQNTTVNVRRWVREGSGFFIQPWRILRTYQPASYLQSDFMASLTVAIVLLPQAIAYALIAELPPQVGLYAAVVATAVGALWGSSFHLHTGPTNTTSLLVLAGLSAVAAAGTEEYLLAAGVMAFWAGVIRLLMGIARLGVLVNFVSDSVIVGFTAGAGLLIMANQARHLLRVSFDSSPSFFTTLAQLAQTVNQAHLPSLGLGGAVIIILLFLKRHRPRWPRELLMALGASGIVALLQFNGDSLGLVTLGEIPRSLPPLVSLPIFDITIIRDMAPSILAVALVGLIEAASISRAVAARSGQYLDSDQEFVGQGLANIVAGFFSGYPVAGSLSRSLVNYEAGAKTQIAAVLGAVWLLLAMLLLAPAAAFLPRTALAGILIVVGARMVNLQEMKRIWRTSVGDAGIMITTWLATLLLPLEFAVLTGVLISFARFIAKTSRPGVLSMLPDKQFAHFEHQPQQEQCPQLGVITIMGSLYFGAAPYVENQIRQHMQSHPAQKFLLLRMHRVNHCDVSGLHMLETVVQLYRQRGGDLFMVGVRDAVRQKISLSDFDLLLGLDHFLEQETAIIHIFEKILNPAVCVYQCRLRVWRECQDIPKSKRAIPLPQAAEQPFQPLPERLIAPQALWAWLSDDERLQPRLIDVREPFEYAEGHLRSAELIPMLDLLSTHKQALPQQQPIVLVCRTGRRSHQVVYILSLEGFDNVYSLKGGMLALELANL